MAAEGAGRILATPAEIERALGAVPQQAPFRFIDEILELSTDHIVGRYTYRPDEWFYRGHFPGRPITPGVILIETIAQTAVVALGIHLHLRGGGVMDKITLFSDCEIEFAQMVPPGTTVTVHAEKIFFRRHKLKSSARLELPDGTVAASGTLSGIGVDLPVE